MPSALVTNRFARAPIRLPGVVIATCSGNRKCLIRMEILVVCYSHLHEHSPDTRCVGFRDCTPPAGQERYCRSIHSARGRPPESSATATVPKKRTLSAAARKRIAEAQRKRWAVLKSAKKRASGAKPAKNAAHAVTVKRVPPKQQRERKPRISKKRTAVKHALSSASGTVAVSTQNAN